LPGAIAGELARLGRARRIGLLGGSFNPAHAAHRRISLRALRLLRLDAVWWLVSPQNPLKESADMAPLGARLAQARRIAGYGPIRVTAIETMLGTRYSADTLPLLRRRLPQARFVWIIGADNLAQLHAWKRWPELMRIVPVAIFDRPTYSRRALTSPAARRFAGFRKPAREVARLAGSPAPAWAFITGALDPLSATALRQSGAWSGGEVKKRSVT
jgi:nicotinate-nucleotide adenylyltransferase